MKKYDARFADSIRKIFEILADNEYSFLWDLVDDFEFNGHHVSVKNSTQWNHVIVDRGYSPIDYSSGKCTYVDSDGVKYKCGLDYTMAQLLKPAKVEESAMDFGNGSKEEIRKAIAEKVHLTEDKYIREFDRSSDEYKKLEAAANLMTAFSGSTRYWVGETYFDFGQDWTWTTILAKDSMEYQALSPRDQQEIITASSPTELARVAERVMK